MKKTPTARIDKLLGSMGYGSRAEIARLARAGKKRIAVMAPAFSADCVETLEEINEEIRHSFVEAGGESFTYIPCLNADAAHMDALTGVIRRELAGWV